MSPVCRIVFNENHHTRIFLLPYIAIQNGLVVAATSLNEVVRLHYKIKSATMQCSELQCRAVQWDPNTASM